MSKTVMIVDDSASVRRVVGIAVIMLSTESEESKKREGQAAGAKAWVVKPFQPEQLVGAVQRLCLP